jgi:hypothetical protein
MCIIHEAGTFQRRYQASGMLPGESHFFPGFDAASQYHDVLVSQVGEFFCLTGRSGFLGSCAVEDDLLVFGKSRKLLFEIPHFDRAFQVIGLTPGFILVRADKERTAGFNPLKSVFRCNAFGSHLLPPLADTLTRF